MLDLSSDRRGPGRFLSAISYSTKGPDIKIIVCLFLILFCQISVTDLQSINFRGNSCIITA